MSPLAKAAKEAFHKVLQAKGRRLDQACLEDAWEQVVEVVKKELRTAWLVDKATLDGSVDLVDVTSVFGEKE